MINFLSGIESTSAALAAERTRMDIINQNIANANVSRGIDGKPYQRQQVVFETVLNRTLSSGGAESPQTLRVAKIVSDNRPPITHYDPSNPDADANGYVSLPDVRIYEEMADMITSSRAFEANLAVVKNARQIALQTLSIGKR